MTIIQKQFSPKTLPISLLLAWLASSGSTALANDEFFSGLSDLCGTTYVGEMTYPTDGQDSFKGKQLVAEFAECNAEQILIPFHVGSDKSRTWVISKTDGTLSLKHDHRHKDGTPDEVSNYGGNADDNGTALSQSFPADDFTQQLIPEAATNVWTLSLSDDSSQLTYHLERHNKPRFTAVLTRIEK